MELELEYLYRQENSVCGASRLVERTGRVVKESRQSAA